ncbi:MAG: DHH family phosphoesterase [Clostridia bacterium]|nr:DHH family phosphoesterase [Clostridia bacterium]
MQGTNDSLKHWAGELASGSRFALFCHKSPDGDTVGAALALRLALLALGKEAVVYCADPLPRSLSYLPGAETVQNAFPDSEAGYLTAVAVDVSSPELMGSLQAAYDKCAGHLLIDHHISNPLYGEFNFVRGGESSCCLLVYEVIRELGIPIDAGCATCLLLGMSTDTGHFRYANTSPETLEAAAQLMRCGADISDISRRMYRSQPAAKVELTRLALNSLHFEADHRIGIIVLRKEDYERSGCSYAEADGLVNLALEIEGVRMAFLLSEREGVTKASLRAMEPDTVNDIASALGGGGHAQAAGCTLMMPPEEAERAILTRMKEKLVVG